MRLSWWARATACALALLVLVIFGVYGYEELRGAGSAELTDLMLVNLIAVLGLQVFIGNSGLLSFTHVALSGLAAYGTALLCTSPGIKASLISSAPLGLAKVQMSPAEATLIGVLLATAVGTLVGLVIARLAGMAASIVTLAGLIITNNLLSNADTVTGGAQGFFGIPQLTSKTVLFGAVGVALLVARLFKETRSGRQLQASRDDDLAAQAMGVKTRRLRLIAWVLSVALVSLAGALRAQVVGTITPELFFFELTFTTLAMLVVGGTASVTGAVAGTVLVTALQEAARTIGDGTTIAGINIPMITGLPTLVLGAALVLIMIKRPAGLLGRFELDALMGAERPRRVSAAGAAARRDGTRLAAQDVTVAFGPIRAVADASLHVRRDEVVGLIGANGAGKTTMLGVLSGLVPLTAGEVRLDDSRLDGRAPSDFARTGVARTFQNIRLFSGLTATEHVEAAVSASGSGGSVAALSFLEEAGIGRFGRSLPGALSYGDRRRLEIARAMATRPAFVLLDEPAAGMNATEAEALAARIRAARKEHGCGVLLIDHDLPFVFDLCDRIYVMAAGRIIAEGSPEEVRSNPAVIASYLGEGAPGSTTDVTREDSVGDGPRVSGVQG